MENSSPIILWFRKDFRLADHPALSKASKTGRPIVPLFVLDEVAESYGAASKWRLERALESFELRLEKIGSRLILRRGNIVEAIMDVVRETGAQNVWWTRAYDPDAIVRDTLVKGKLKNLGVFAQSFPGHVLFEPWTVSPSQQPYFKVYSPFWRAVKDIALPEPETAPTHLRNPNRWPKCDLLKSWQLGKAVKRGGAILNQHACVGEIAALDRLETFVRTGIDAYKARRDYPSEAATSRLSENLAWGEIGPRTVWRSALHAQLQGFKGAEHFRKELVWREFAYHLLFHTPRIARENWKLEWDRFPWSAEEDQDVLRWKQGRTGVPMVDAAMREMFVTGYMHNRGRMIAGSYLTKHMLKHWRIGQKWFEDCLIDWDPAANALGWQWIAGSGPDSAPYFRIFNPDTQAEKFDLENMYVHRFVAELSSTPSAESLDYFNACPKAWGLSADAPYPKPVVELALGRRRALAAYEALKIN